MTALLDAPPSSSAGTTRSTARHRSGARSGVSVRGLAQAGTRVLTNLVLVGAVLTFLGLAVGPHVLGYRTMTMLTGSMAPLINPGDVTVVTPIPAADVEPGMIISYAIPVEDHRVVSHRVVSVTRGDGGSVTVQTKGDANPGDDPWTATLQGDTAYQVRGVVPELGHLIRLLRTPGLETALVWGVPALVAGWVLLSMWRPRRVQD